MQYESLTVSELIDILSRCPSNHRVMFYEDGWEKKVRVVGVSDDSEVILASEITENFKQMEIV